MCFHCPLRRTCVTICGHVEAILPSLEAGRVDAEDFERLYQGRIMMNALLDNADLLTEKQQHVVQLYYRENRGQDEIARTLSITQQAVNDSLTRARKTIGEKLKRYYNFWQP